MTDKLTPFMLSSQVKGHAADVRSIHSPSHSSLLLSTSRDKSLIAWLPTAVSSSKTPEYHLQRQWKAPYSSYVSSVTSVHVASSNEDYILTGSQDGMINGFLIPGTLDPETFHIVTHDDADILVPGHTGNVVCIAPMEDGGFVSGSWASQVLVHSPLPSPHLVATLSGHASAVWSIAVLSPTQIISGSADKSIILWEKDLSGKWSKKRSYTGHSDAVRGLTKIDAERFISSSNDGTIKIWSLNSTTPLQSLDGHTSFIYSLIYLPDTQEIASVSEDRTLRIWSPSSESTFTSPFYSNTQTIQHPTTSVWCVTSVTLPNGSLGLATGSSDGTIRIFTRDESLKASEEELKVYDSELAGMRVDLENQVGTGGVKKDDVPLKSIALGATGKKEGEVKMVKDDITGVVEAHQWSSATFQWTKIGDVVDAVGAGTKKLYNGQEYDYIFDVDIQEGAPPLKLPYNISENPYMAAKKFLENNDLPPGYLDEVVGFIETNTKGVTLGQDAPSNEYVDPFTGASRYQASSSSVPMQAATGVGYVDPYSGSNRYVPASSEAITTSTATPSAPARKKVRAGGVIPVETYMEFKQANLVALGKKLQDLAGEEMCAPEEKVALKALVVAAGGVGSKGKDWGLLWKLIGSWDAGKRFPLIDLARLLILSSPSFATFTPEGYDSTLLALLGSCDFSHSWPEAPSKERDTNTMLALRAVTNLFRTTEGRKVAAGSTGALFLQALISCPHVSSFNKNIRVAISSIALNYSILAVEGDLPSPLKSDVVDLITSILAVESASTTSDSEAIYRAIAALGNVLYTFSSSLLTPKDSALSSSISDALKEMSQAADTLGNEDRVVQLVSEVQGIKYA